jgi:hypothetical protein
VIVNSRLLGSILAALVVLTTDNTASQGESRAPVADPANSRRVVAMVPVGSNGISDAMEFVVPPKTAAVTVVVHGADERLYALASLRAPDGTEHVNIDLSRSYGADMERSYRNEVGAMVGDLYQNIRLGTFTTTYPYLNTQVLGAGKAQLRVASNRAGGEVRVTVLMPEENAQTKTLHINLIVVSDKEWSGRANFLGPAQQILSQAAIHVVVDEIRYLRQSGFSRITEWTEPQEKPRSQLARLALAGRKLVSSDALSIFLVDALPGDVYGISLGTPGPPISSSYYYGVVLRQLESDDFMGRVFAHEVCHFLGLTHLVDFGASGTRHSDPFPDTEPAQGNLMESSGLMLTPTQIFALSRSPLLVNSPAAVHRMPNRHHLTVQPFFVSTSRIRSRRSPWISTPPTTTAPPVPQARFNSAESSFRNG